MTKAFQDMLKKINLTRPKEQVKEISSEYKEQILNKIENFLTALGAEKTLIKAVLEVAKKVVYEFSDSSLKDSNQQLGTIGEIINYFSLEEVIKAINENLNKMIETEEE
jgi:glycyl-tRNA synthetase beta subunit